MIVLLVTKGSTFTFEPDLSFFFIGDAICTVRGWHQWPRVYGFKQFKHAIMNLHNTVFTMGVDFLYAVLSLVLTLNLGKFCFLNDEMILLFHFKGIYLLSKVSLFIVRFGLLTVLLTGKFIDWIIRVPILETLCSILVKCLTTDKTHWWDRVSITGPQAW